MAIHGDHPTTLPQPDLTSHLQQKLDGGFNVFSMFTPNLANNHHLERHFALFTPILLHIALYNHYRIYI